MTTVKEEATPTPTPDPKETAAKSLCDAAISMIKKAEEMFTNKDFKCVFAIAEAQGFKYQGPIIQEPAQELIKAVQAFQTAWK